MNKPVNRAYILHHVVGLVMNYTEEGKLKNEPIRTACSGDMEPFLYHHRSPGSLPHLANRLFGGNFNLGIIGGFVIISGIRSVSSKILGR